jgi:maleylacetate reductase
MRITQSLDERRHQAFGPGTIEDLVMSEDVMHPAGTHLFPTMDRVIFGKEAAATLAAEVDRLGKRRVFLMVSRTLNTTTSEIEKLRAALGERFAGSYDQIPQHTSRQAAVDAARAAAAANADLVVAVGGGSVIDAAKIALICIEHMIFEPDLLDGFEIKVGPDRLPVRPTYRPPSVRMIAIPSTLSGGEYNAGCLVTDTRRNLKQTFFHPMMMPLAIILDPALTLHTPEVMWLGSGTRAMDHAIEALCSNNGTPLVDACVLRGVQLMAANLPASRAAPENVRLRGQCQIASWLCSAGLQARVWMGASHAIGHVLGGSFGVAHYLCTPVMMQGVLRYNQPSTTQAQSQLAGALGRPGGSAVEALGDLFQSLGLPTRLSDVGITESQFETIARITMREEMFIHTNPRGARQWEDVRDILELAA